MAARRNARSRLSQHAVKHRGWLLVQTGRSSFSALRDGGGGRAYLGVMRHGDWDGLVRRFRARVDEIEDGAD